MSTASGFNTAASDFPSEVKAATEVFARNPSDLEPFKVIEQKLMQRRKTHAQNMIAATDGSSFVNPLEISSQAASAMLEAMNAPPLEAPQKVADFMNGMRDRLNAVTVQVEENQNNTIALRDGNQSIQADYGVFAAAVQGLPAQYADNPDACHDSISDLAANTVTTQKDLATQQKRIEAMVAAGNEQLTYISSLRNEIGKQLLQCNEAVVVTEAFKDFIDACSTGTRQPVTVKKPLSLRKAASPA